MTHNTYPGMPSNRELIVGALRYSSTQWGLWNRDSYTAKVVEPITIEAQTLRDRPLGRRDAVIVTTENETSGQKIKWGFDGEVMVRLPRQDPQTRQFVRAEGEKLFVLRGAKCPNRVAIEQYLPGSSDLMVTAVTFGGDFAKETGIWEPSAAGFQPEDVAVYALPSPLQSVQRIVHSVRQSSGLPPNVTPMSPDDARKIFGLR